MPSIFDPPDPVARRRGKVMLKRFKSPEGVSAGFMGSFVSSMIEWRESGSSKSHKAWLSHAIDVAMTPAPSPTPTMAIGAAKTAERERIKRMSGRHRTRLTSPGFLMPVRRRGRGTLG